MSNRTIALQRLHNQRIPMDTRLETPQAVVQHMGALQAQDYHQALWAVGVRMQSSTIADVEKALADGEIVRTWPMRGTIHFVPAADTKWMLRLCAERVVAGHGRRMAQLELTNEIMMRSEQLFINALSGRKCMTRADLLQMVEDEGISTKGQRGYHILWHLAHHGLICLGPMDGKQQTFVLLDEWVPIINDLTREEALATLVLRFFTSHGPATEADFARWAGLTLTDTRAGLAMNQAYLISETIDDETYWSVLLAAHHSQAIANDAFLLPGFDEYYLGYKDRGAVISDEHAPWVVPGNNGIFKPMIVLGGQVVGIWKRKIKRKSIDITLQPFIDLDDHYPSLEVAAETYCRFMQLPIGKLDVT